MSISSNPKMATHPDKCPNCSNDRVFYQRHNFTPYDRGHYFCEDCGWLQDVLTGVVSNKGKSKIGNENEDG